MKKISLVLCLIMIFWLFAGCAVKPSEGPEATGEIFPEVSSEITKERTSENIQTTQEKEEIKNPEKEDESTPEFYDFMILDPEPEWTLSTTQEYRKIVWDLIDRKDIYKETGKVTFTKKEVYYLETYDDSSIKYKYIDLFFKHGKDKFYSEKTKEKLDNLGFEFYEPYFFNTGLRHLTEKGSMKKFEKDERIEDVKTALKIILEDHNVAYVHLYALV